MIRDLFKVHIGRREPPPMQIEPTVDEPTYGEVTMTSQTRTAAAKMMVALQNETDMMRGDVLAEIDFSKATINALAEAEQEECDRIDREAESRKAATRKMFGELKDTERRRIEQSERRLKHLDGDELAMP